MWENFPKGEWSRQIDRAIAAHARLVWGHGWVRPKGGHVGSMAHDLAEPCGPYGPTWVRLKVGGLVMFLRVFCWLFDLVNELIRYFVSCFC